MAYQQCDSYFVEEQESFQSQSRQQARDYAKLIARQRQELLANDLSRQACEDYLEDIMKHMRQMEVIHLDLICLLSSYADT